MKRVKSIIILLLAVVSLYGQDIVGSWSGVLEVPDTGMGESKLTVVFHFEAAENGYKGTIDSPDQNAFGHAMDTVVYKKPEVSLAKAEWDVKYVGSIAEDGKLKGTLTQMGGSLELIMTRVEE